MSNEHTHRGELVAFPGPYEFWIGKSPIILVSDRELEALADPDCVLNLTLTYEPQQASLRQVCERAQQAGHRTLIIAFDHFFTQYRPGQEGPRRLTPDMDEYVGRIAAISRFAEQYGLGLELSLLSPLEIGPAWRARTGKPGRWMHYRKGLRDPESGAFSVQLWRQRRWVNNKGPIDIEEAGVRVFAFREQPIGGTPYRVVRPNEIVEISEVAQSEVWEHTRTPLAVRARIHGRGRGDVGPLDRVLVVQQYATPEMDYFSDQAFPFLTELIDRYADAGVRLNGLYADEMHIQQDWSYFDHHDHGEFALRYVSEGLERAFAERYGAEYRDFAKYMVYFVHGQEDFAAGLSAKSGVMHVFGPEPEDVHRTALFRSRYYELLQDGVVDLFVRAKRHAERRMGRPLESRAHATWAESPTIDAWDVGSQPRAPHQYEYTPSFLWSCTVHQAASACHDYFRWGDFLTGNGNDHAECGWLDRDYFGLALGCSTGILNDVPYSYAAHWGMPDAVGRRRMALVSTYGAAGSPIHGLVQNLEHRDVDVLMLYPLDLVSVEERFGSWMTQYGYANYVTQAKLLERGCVRDGAIELAGRRFTTLVALFEPFPSAKLLTMMNELVKQGGRVVWSGPPPLLSRDGERALAAWSDLFGLDFAPAVDFGLPAPGCQVLFEGACSGVAPQTILTHFLVDRIYPVAPRSGSEPIARVKGLVVGTLRRVGDGLAAFLGYRPRDDQAASLGYEMRNWFETLSALGAYPPTGRFAGINDNTEHLSRSTEYLACRFPNGAVSICRHLRELEECWPGGFARNAEQDRAIVERLPLPSEAIRLSEFRVHGHVVSFDGDQPVTLRLDGRGQLVAFAGARCSEITVDGRRFAWSERLVDEIAWAPVSENRRVAGGAVLQLWVRGEGAVHIPVPTLSAPVALFAEGPQPGSRGEPIPCSLRDGRLSFTLPAAASGRWLYVVPQ